MWRKVSHILMHFFVVTRSSLNSNNDKTTYGAFLDVDPVSENLSLRSLVRFFFILLYIRVFKKGILFSTMIFELNLWNQLVQNTQLGLLLGQRSCSKSALIHVFKHHILIN